MMRRILDRIGGGAFTLPTLAAELGISKESLCDRLGLMERLGQITRESCSSSQGPEACSHCCMSCACSAGEVVEVRYVLTEKGRRLCERHRG